MPNLMQSCILCKRVTTSTSSSPFICYNCLHQLQVLTEKNPQTIELVLTSAGYVFLKKINHVLPELSQAFKRLERLLQHD